MWRTARRLWSAEGVGAVLGLMLLHRLLARALSTMGSYYELDRFELSQAELGYLNSYKTALSLGAPVLLGYVIGGGESWRLSEADVLHIAVWATVAAHVRRGGPINENCTGLAQIVGQL